MKDPYGYARARATDWPSCKVFILSMLGDAFWCGEITGKEWREQMGQLREAWIQRKCLKRD